MSYRDVYISERTMFQRVDENRQEVEVRRLIRQLKAAQPSRSSRVLRAFVCEVGYRMVVFGAWLERFSASQPSTLRGNAG